MLFNAQIISDSCFKIINGALLFRRQCSMSLILSRFDINDIPSVVGWGSTLHLYLYIMFERREGHTLGVPKKIVVKMSKYE